MEICKISHTIHICDWIWENVHSSHIRFCSFGDPQMSYRMVYRFETFRNDEGIVVLQFLKVSHLSVFLNRFYESPKLKNWMCVLCTFSQIQSHIYITSFIHSYHRCGKICWIKRLWFQFNWSFRGNTFALSWPEVIII